jgi:hypothetical protein
MACDCGKPQDRCYCYEGEETACAKCGAPDAHLCDGCEKMLCGKCAGEWVIRSLRSGESYTCLACEMDALCDDYPVMGAKLKALMAPQEVHA